MTSLHNTPAHDTPLLRRSMDFIARRRGAQA